MGPMGAMGSIGPIRRMEPIPTTVMTMKTPPYPNRPSILQYWFPLLLGFLLLLCVPGAVLLLLHLLGLENAVNGWMQQHFSLSYHIPIPSWAALLLLLMPFFIALLYFLKLKRKP